jgi:hypothetical protein
MHWHLARLCDNRRPRLRSARAETSWFHLLLILLDDFQASGSTLFGGGLMATVKIPKKSQDRLVSGLKRYQPIVGKLRERDISEADTVTVVKDMLTDIFGYDKYTELTSEQQIRGTF